MGQGAAAPARGRGAGPRGKRARSRPARRARLARHVAIPRHAALWEAAAAHQGVWAGRGWCGRSRLAWHAACRMPQGGGELKGLVGHRPGPSPAPAARPRPVVAGRVWERRWWRGGFRCCCCCFRPLGGVLLFRLPPPCPCFLVPDCGGDAGLVAVSSRRACSLACSLVGLLRGRSRLPRGAGTRHQTRGKGCQARPCLGCCQATSKLLAWVAAKQGLGSKAEARKAGGLESEREKGAWRAPLRRPSPPCTGREETFPSLHREGGDLACAR
jgi:hypothetical protein